MRAVAIIQARMGSSRLPGKVLAPLAGVPVLRRVYDRVVAIEGLAEVVVATTTSPGDDRLVAYCAGERIPIVRGSEDDVLDRYVQAARGLDAEIVMRITADCPFIDPKVSQRVLELLLASPECEYTSNITTRTYPDGLDTEVVRRATLERVWATIGDPIYREHVTHYIAKHPDQFRVLGVTSPVDHSQHRWTLDWPEDYEMLSAIAQALQRRGQLGYHEEILRLLEDHPEIVRINAKAPFDGARPNRS